jgi:hypothetical protein
MFARNTKTIGAKQPGRHKWNYRARSVVFVAVADAIAADDSSLTMDQLASMSSYTPGLSGSSGGIEIGCTAFHWTSGVNEIAVGVL